MSLCDEVNNLFEGKKVKLQSDIVNGVYSVRSFDKNVDVIDPEMFFSSLKGQEKHEINGTIISITSAIYKKIEKEYGIH